MQLMTEGEVLQFQNGPTAEPAGNNRDDGAHMFKHPENTMAVNPKTLGFSALSEFSVGTTIRENANKAPRAWYWHFVGLSLYQTHAQVTPVTIAPTRDASPRIETFAHSSTSRATNSLMGSTIHIRGKISRAPESANSFTITK